MRYRYFFNSLHEDIIYRYDTIEDKVISRDKKIPNKNCESTYTETIGLEYLQHSINLMEIDHFQANEICKEWYYLQKLDTK